LKPLISLKLASFLANKNRFKDREDVKNLIKSASLTKDDVDGLEESVKAEYNAILQEIASEKN
jgi:hypothetical protein